MNKNKLAILTFSAAIIFASCRKNDLQHQETPNVPEAVAVTKAWTSDIAWSTSKQEKFTVYSGTINDQSITGEVADKGLVLVFKKNGTTVQSLPFEEKGTNDAYWYYQVAKGQVAISCDNYGAEQKVADNAFQYFVVSAEQLTVLEAKGYSSFKLLQLSYDEATALLK
jgi:hypothetical protein